MSSSDMSAGAEFIHNNNPDHLITGAVIDMNGTKLPIGMEGGINPSEANPFAYKYLQNDDALYQQFQNSVAGGAFNDNFYNNMKMQQQNQIVNTMNNQFASSGLAGSSAAMGGINQAIQNNQMSWLNRQQGDQMRAMQGLEALNQQGMKDTMSLQKQYGDFQDMYLQTIANAMGLQAGQNAANTAQTGQIWSAGLGAVGSAAGRIGK